MAKKKQTDVTNGTAVMDPPEATPVPETEATNGEPPPVETNGHAEPTQPTPPETSGRDPRRPVYSLKCNSDRNTQISVAVWANEVTYTSGEVGVQYSVTHSRSYKDQFGKWHNNNSLRVHDVVILQHLLTRAYGWCLDQRITTSAPF